MSKSSSASCSNASFVTCGPRSRRCWLRSRYISAFALQSAIRPMNGFRSNGAYGRSANCGGGCVGPQPSAFSSNDGKVKEELPSAIATDRYVLPGDVVRGKAISAASFSCQAQWRTRRRGC